GQARRERWSRHRQGSARGFLRGAGFRLRVRRCRPEQRCERRRTEAERTTPDSPSEEGGKPRSAPERKENIVSYHLSNAAGSLVSSGVSHPAISAPCGRPGSAAPPTYGPRAERAREGGGGSGSRSEDAGGQGPPKPSLTAQRFARRAGTARECLEA